MSPYRFELKGGPLAGREVRIADTEVRLSVVREGPAWRLDPGDGAPAGDGWRAAGHYGFSHREESLVWFPAVR